uniref:Predicted protein n=2 Tax=Hordeum vulgare subsp. vulgare TaxID=112509 RepID=F2DRQ7_HORVV|nr:predicted protein [Hordeum vulgare subsp. vulgare]
MCGENRWDGRCRHRRSRCADGRPRASWLRARRAATGRALGTGRARVRGGTAGRPRTPRSCATKVRRGHGQARETRPRRRHGLPQSRPDQQPERLLDNERRGTMKATLKRLFFSSR